MGKKLLVLAKGSSMVPDHAGNGGQFIGREYSEAHGVSYEHSDERGIKSQRIQGAFIPKGEPTELDQDDNRAHWIEYFNAVRSGDLWAADEATAKMCGVKFDPKFGGQYEKGVALAVKSNKPAVAAAAQEGSK